MTKFTKKQLAEKAAIIVAIEGKRAALEGAIEQFNRDVHHAKGLVEDAVRELNEAQVAAVEFRDAIVSDQESYFDDKSEKWQEGDVGQSYQSWKDEWAGADLEAVEIEFPDEIEMPDSNVAETLESLPDSP